MYRLKSALLFCLLSLSSSAFAEDGWGREVVIPVESCTHCDLHCVVSVPGSLPVEITTRLTLESGIVYLDGRTLSKEGDYLLPGMNNIELKDYTTQTAASIILKKTDRLVMGGQWFELAGNCTVSRH